MVQCTSLLQMSLVFDNGIHMKRLSFYTTTTSSSNVVLSTIESDPNFTVYDKFLEQLVLR